MRSREIFLRLIVFEHVCRDGLARIEPRPWNSFAAGVQDDNASDDGTGGITVAESAHSRPQRVFIVVQMARRVPKGKWNSVRSRNHSAVSKSRNGFFD